VCDANKGSDALSIGICFWCQDSLRVAGRVSRGFELVRRRIPESLRSRPRDAQQVDRLPMGSVEGPARKDGAYPSHLSVLRPSPCCQELHSVDVSKVVASLMKGISSHDAIAATQRSASCSLPPRPWPARVHPAPTRYRGR